MYVCSNLQEGQKVRLINKLKLVKILKHTFNNIQVGNSIYLLTGTLKVTLERFLFKTG